MEEPTILKGGPPQLPEFHRASGTFYDGTNTVYNPAEPGSWAGFQISSRKQELPLAYLPIPTAWQHDGSTPEDSDRFLVWPGTSSWPLKPPKTVVLRGFSSEIIDDGIIAFAEVLQAAGIMVVKDPFSSVSGTGIYPALPVTDFTVMNHGHPSLAGDGTVVDPGDVNVPVVRPEEFIGGDILEIWNVSERDSLGGYVEVTTASAAVHNSFPGYDVEYETTTEAITAHRTVSSNTYTGASGTGASSTTSWDSSWTIVLVSNPGPPPFLEIHVKGILINPLDPPSGARFPVSQTISSGTTTGFQWDGLITASKDYYLSWIPRCFRFRGVLLVRTGTVDGDPVEFHSDSIFGKIDTSMSFGLNPATRGAMQEFVDQVGDGFEINEVADNDEAAQLAAIVALIADQFDVDLS